MSDISEDAQTIDEVDDEDDFDDGWSIGGAALAVLSFTVIAATLGFTAYEFDAYPINGRYASGACVENVPTAAYEAARDRVQRQLISQNRAIFSNPETWATVAPGNCVWGITVEVDAPNRQGTNVHSEWITIVELAEEGLSVPLIELKGEPETLNEVVARSPAPPPDPLPEKIRKARATMAAFSQGQK